jgi:hypothetical protein
MRRSCLPNSTRMIAGLLTSLLFAILTVPLTAESTPESHAARPMSFGYDKAHEITLNGTIQEVVTQRIAGSPAGLHLLISGSQGMVDAHLGAFLSQDTRDALHSGEWVQIVGAMTKINGKDYLLARQLILGDRTVAIRTQRGFLLHSVALRASPAQTETNGGAR